MRVRIKDNCSLIIMPETDFEEEYLRRYSSEGSNKVWLKHGLSVADLVGLVIERVPSAQEKR
jgi:hypothetical protein